MHQTKSQQTIISVEMFNDTKLGEKSSGKLYKQYDLNYVKNVCLHNMEEIDQSVNGTISIW